MPTPTAARVLRISAVTVVTLALMAVAVVAGFWQMGRHETRSEARSAYETAAALAPAPLSEVVPAGSDSLPADAVWRTVDVVGSYDSDSLRALRTRPIEGTPAWQFLVWFDTDDGRSLLVNAGWIRQPGPLEDPRMPEFPDGDTAITVVLRPWEDDDGKESGFTVSRITPAQLPTPAHDAVPGYGMLRDDCPGGCPWWTGAEVPLPELTLGPHLAYAWQWWLIAALLPVGAFTLLRREGQTGTGGGADTAGAAAQQGRAEDVAAPASRRRRGTRGPTDEEIEDAL